MYIIQCYTSVHIHSSYTNGICIRYKRFTNRYTNRNTNLKYKFAIVHVVSCKKSLTTKTTLDDWSPPTSNTYCFNKRYYSIDYIE